MVTPAPSLVKDYFRFVITFFEVISASAPHIYHSALPLSPRQSTVRKLYEQYARPSARVVHGLSFSWEPIVATFGHHDFGLDFAWSPCTRFIAIAGSNSSSISIVDAVTLKQLNTIEPPQGQRSRGLSFSPDSRLLTQFSDGKLTSWDLQTGVPVGAIPFVDEVIFPGFSSAYSADGKVIAVACNSWVTTRSNDDTTFTIATYNLHSRTPVYSYTVPKGRVMAPIWTHGGYIRFATVEPGSIRMWEIPFNSMNTPEEVDSLLLPDEIRSLEDLLFLPTPFRFAFTLRKKVSVLDVQGSKLLDFTARNELSEMSFSPDGRFFACSTRREVHVWKESPIGYELHQNLVLKETGAPSTIFFSQNGESIIMCRHSSVSLWPTGYPIVPPCDIPDWQPGNWGSFLPAFSQDETLVAVRPEGNRVVILDLESGDSRLSIDAGMKIGCLGVTGSKVVVASCEKAVAWDIPARGSVLDSSADMDDDVHTTTFDDSARLPIPLEPFSFINTAKTISPDLNYVAIIKGTGSLSCNLDIYDTWTGKRLTGCTTGARLSIPYFTPDRREIWSVGDWVTRWTIMEEGESRLIKLEPLEWNAQPRRVLPWESPCGYKIADSGWVLSPTQKRLLWLPHYLRSDHRERVWQGRFLGFSHGEPPEIATLEFLE